MDSIKTFTEYLTKWIFTHNDDCEEYYDSHPFCDYAVDMYDDMMKCLTCLLERGSKYFASLPVWYPKDHPKYHDEVKSVSVDIEKYAKYIASMAVRSLTDNGIGKTRISSIISTKVFSDQSMAKAIFEDKSIQAIKDANTVKGVKHTEDDTYDEQTIKVGETIINTIIELLSLH